MKKSLRFVALALVMIIIFAGLSVVCRKSQKETAQQLVHNAEYIIKTKEDPHSVMKEAYDNGMGPIQSFYLGYDFENPESYWAMPAYDFHSELRNAKGEILAEYTPFLLLKGETDTGKADYRVILFNEDYNLVSEDSSGEVTIWGDNPSEGWGDTPFDVLAYFSSQVLEAEGVDPNCGKPLEIYGTCDDTFVYVEKMVWYHVDCDITYTYTTQPYVSRKGTVPVEDWINTLKDKKIVMEKQNLPDIYEEKGEQSEEAKELCKKLSEAYLEANRDSTKLEKPENSLETYAIEKVKDLGNGYFVSSVFVFHPLEQAGAELPLTQQSLVWGLLLSCLVVGIIGICLLYKERNEKATEKNTAKKEKES